MTGFIFDRERLRGAWSAAERPVPWAAMSFLLAAAAAVSGCGGGQGTMTKPDGGPDAPDGDAPRMGVMCPAAAAGEKRGLGACCTADANCAGGVCWDGYCTKACAATAECGPVVAPSPLPVGTPMACAANQLGDTFSLCLPGSLAPCAPGAACPKGEACALGLAPAAVPPANASSGAYAGMCLTTLIANMYPPAGSTCQPEDGPYACETQGGYLGSGCLAHRCSNACATDADCPVAMFCSPPPFSAKQGGAANFLADRAGTGVCLGRRCGQVHGQAGLATLQVTQQGADAACPPGEICTPTVAVGATGETAYLSCVPPRAGALPYGSACSADPAAGQRCGDDSLCVARAGGTPFCSALCRTDADCAAGSLCLDDYSIPLPNTSVARLGMCTPRTLVVGTPCQAERDCPATQACLPVGTRSSSLFCQPAVGAKSVGDTCAAAADCRSGECVDRDLHNPTGKNRTSCGGFCGRNSDCGAGQICLPVVRNNNATVDDPTDDLTLGYCTTLDAPPLAGSCKDDLDCAAQAGFDEAGGDTCDLGHLTCYKKAARIGDACVHRAECPLGAYCRVNDPRFPRGACLSLGCLPGATMGPDACPVGSVCGQRGVDRPLYGCYEGCGAGMSCSREAEKYFCDGSAALGVPAGAGICLWSGST